MRLTVIFRYYNKIKSNLTERLGYWQQNQATTDVLVNSQGFSIVGFNVHSTHYKLFRRRFYWSDDPTNSVTALKDNG